MSNQDRYRENGNPDNLPDPKQKGLEYDLMERLRHHDQAETDIENHLDEKAREHRRHVDRKNRHINLVENVESERMGKLLTERSLLEADMTAAEEVAGKAMADLGLEYISGQTTVDDVYAITRLSESDAADKAGVSGVHGSAMGGSHFIKWMGMAGCFVLGTVGMGAMVMQVPPKQLFTQPIALVISAFLSFVVVGGVYMMVHPTWKRIGTMAATRDVEKAAKARQTGILFSAIGILAVATIDAKAILAINATRALVDPAHAITFAMAFLVGLCLSSVYVIGASIVAYHDAFGLEAARRIKAEQTRHERAEMQDQRLYVEVRNAIEALNAVAVLTRRRQALDPKIKAVQDELQATLDSHYASIPDAPEMPTEHKSELNMHKKQAKFAAWKVQAHDALKRLNSDSDKGDA